VHTQELQAQGVEIVHNLPQPRPLVQHAEIPVRWNKYDASKPLEYWMRDGFLYVRLQRRADVKRCEYGDIKPVEL
jgi:hypothetical protein